MNKNKKLNILHVSEIDNNLGKGTSVIIPQYVLYQSKTNNNVGLLNCNNIILKKLSNLSNIFVEKDNAKFGVLKKFKPDIVIFHEVYKPKYIKIYKFCLKNNIPYIIIPHGCLTERAQNNKKIKKIIGNLLLFNSFLKNAKFIQYLSENEYNMSKFKKNMFFILGNGVENIPNNNKYIESKKNINEFNMIYIGRYDYLIKGLDQLILACSLIKEEMVKKKIKINLYGDGEESSKIKILKNINNNDLKDLISFNGPIYGKEKKEQLIKNDVFIQVSRTEGQPLGVMEAMTLGMPLLISKSTGFGEIVKKNNCGIVTECDAKFISESIIKMYDKKNNMTELSKNSYNYSRENFSWENISDLSIKKYISIVKED